MRIVNMISSEISRNTGNLLFYPLRRDPEVDHITPFVDSRDEYLRGAFLTIAVNSQTVVPAVEDPVEFGNRTPGDRQKSKRTRKERKRKRREEKAANKRRSRKDPKPETEGTDENTETTE